MLRVVCIAAPVHAAYISGDGQRALQTRWSEKAVISEPLELLPANLAIFRSDTPGVSGGKFLWHDGRGRQRKRLRARGHFSGNIGLRHRPLFHSKYRHARVAIQNIEEACLIALNYHG